MPEPSPASMIYSRQKIILIIFSLAMGGFGIGTGEFAIMGLMPNVALDFGITEPQVGHLISAYALGVVVGAPVLAIFGAQLFRKHLLIALMAFYAVANFASAMAGSYETLMISRFIAGLPHGAYFGVAALVAASLVPLNRRAKAVSYIMMGLALALLFGNPLATLMGQHLEWRYAFGFVACVAALTTVLIFLYLPLNREESRHSSLSELRAFNKPQIWYPLATGAIWSILLACFVVALMVAMGPALQTHLMDVAHGAQTLAAASHHAAFNLANAIGPWLGGMAVSAGMGWQVTGYVGSSTAIAGLLVFFFAQKRGNPKCVRVIS